jgi:hypothetical protein
MSQELPFPLLSSSGGSELFPAPSTGALDVSGTPVRRSTVEDTKAKQNKESRIVLDLDLDLGPWSPSIFGPSKKKPVRHFK